VIVGIVDSPQSSLRTQRKEEKKKRDFLLFLYFLRELRGLCGVIDLAFSGAHWSVHAAPHLRYSGGMTQAAHQERLTP
jgi:hypothetical protein